MRFLFVLFILLGFPALEVFVMVKLAGSIGWWLLLWLIISAVVGISLIQEEKTAMFGRLFSALQSGQPVGYAMLDSMRNLFAGALLIFPGVVSDVLALVLLQLPRPAAPRPEANRPPPGGAGPHREPSAADEIIIEGEWQREEETIKISGGSASDQSRPDR